MQNAECKMQKQAHFCILHFAFCIFGGLPGFVGPVPPPLVMSVPRLFSSDGDYSIAMGAAQPARTSLCYNAYRNVIYHIRTTIHTSRIITSTAPLFSHYSLPCA